MTLGMAPDRSKRAQIYSHRRVSTQLPESILRSADAFSQLGFPVVERDLISMTSRQNRQSLNK